MLVTDRRVCADLVWTVERALQGGIRLVQLRERDLPARELLELARVLRELTLKWNAILLVNDRVDVALLSRADGVHLGEASLPAPEARKLLPRGSLVTCAAHSVETAVEAAQAGADAVVVGTIFETESKPGVRPAGLPFLEAVVRSVRTPVFAIGGIDLQTAPLAVRAGAYGVAVVRAVLAQPDPSAAASALQRAVTSHSD